MLWYYYCKKSRRSLVLPYSMEIIVIFIIPNWVKYFIILPIMHPTRYPRWIIVIGVNNKILNYFNLYILFFFLGLFQFLFNKLLNYYLLFLVID